MYGGGWLCKSGYIAESFYLAAALLLVPASMALLVPATRKSNFQDDLALEARLRRVGVALLVAAVTANLLVLATRSTIVNNYAELNQFLNFEADRMGLLVASALVGQLLGFFFGAVYEPLLGRRTMYAFMAICLILINLAVAYVVNLPLLVCAMVLCGVVAAIGFQTAIIAAVECFRFPRTGTSFHEAMVGLGGMGTFASGMVARHAKSAGLETVDALRAPFVALAVTAAVCLVLQLVLVTWRSHNRLLLQTSDPATRPAQS
jgi:MFS family permease